MNSECVALSISGSPVRVTLTALGLLGRVLWLEELIQCRHSRLSASNKTLLKVGSPLI